MRCPCWWDAIPGPIARSGEPDALHSPDRPGRPSFRAAVPPAGHPPGRAATDCVQRADRRGARLFFPRISLTGLFGFASGSLGSLFSGSARTWSFTGDVAGPIYTGGGLTAAVDQARRGAISRSPITSSSSRTRSATSRIARRRSPQRRASRHREAPRGDASRGRRTGQPSATRMAIPTISRCWTRSAACSAPSCSWHRLAAITSARWSTCTARSAATGPVPPVPDHRAAGASSP